MSVEQTTQLIQLILNSALMLAIAVGWWGVMWLRHSTLVSQIQAHQRRTHRLAADGLLNSDLLTSRRQQRYHLQTRYRLTRHSVLIMHYVLLGLVSSLFCLSLRTLFGGEWLIPAALALFILGVTGLMLSVALALMEFYQINFLEDSTLFSGARSLSQNRTADPRLTAPHPAVTPNAANPAPMWALSVRAGDRAS